jgi:hypothetical protein
VIARTLRPLVGDLRQLASARRIVLDDGSERGVRAIAFSTGGGLDFWVMADRSLDVGPVWSHGVPIAWQSPAGFRNPSLHDSEGDEGRGFDRSFSGFLVTCGLEHVRQPRGGHPLHGRLPFTPARVLAYGEDWDRPDPVLFCEGEVTQFRFSGEALRLRRRIEAPVGGCEVTISDIVDNQSSEPTDHELLYHFNLGFPAIDTGSEVRTSSKRLLGPIALPDTNDRPTAECHPTGGEGISSCVVSTPKDADQSFEVIFAYSAATLPYLQVWRDLRPNAGVISIEPCTSSRSAEASTPLSRTLAPDESRRYSVRIALHNVPRSVSLGAASYSRRRVSGLS